MLCILSDCWFQVHQTLIRLWVMLYTQKTTVRWSQPTMTCCKRINGFKYTQTLWSNGQSNGYRTSNRKRILSVVSKRALIFSLNFFDVFAWFLFFNIFSRWASCDVLWICVFAEFDEFFYVVLKTKQMAVYFLRIQHGKIFGLHNVGI